MLATIPAVPTFWICCAPSVGPNTVETMLPLESTTYIAADRTACPLGLEPERTRACTVHGPAGKLTPPGVSTSQPLQVVGAAGGQATTVELRTGGFAPGMKSAAPVAPAPIGVRVSAPGRTAGPPVTGSAVVSVYAPPGTFEATSCHGVDGVLSPPFCR